MSRSISRIKRKPLIIGASILIGLLMGSIAMFLFGNSASSSSYAICTSARYRLVMNGMNKKMIMTLLGEPDRKLIKQSLDQNFFFQGDNETKIKEGWIYYHEGYVTAAEVYFSNNGQVSGKNCGQG